MANVWRIGLWSGVVVIILSVNSTMTESMEFFYQGQYFLNERPKDTLQ